MDKESLRTDGRGISTESINWTGESQAIAFTDTVGTTEVTLTNKHDLVFYASEPCVITLGCTAGIDNAAATQKNRCFPIGSNTYLRVYVPSAFMSRTSGVEEGNWKLYISVVRIGSSNGTLYVVNSIGQTASVYGGAITTSSSTTTT